MHTNPSKLLAASLCGALLATFPAAQSRPAKPKPERPATVDFVDTDGDGLPDQRAKRSQFGVLRIRHVDLDELCQTLQVFLAQTDRRIVLVPHETSRQLVVSGSPEELGLVQKLVEQLDVEKPEIVRAAEREAKPSPRRSSTARRRAVAEVEAEEPGFLLVESDEVVTLRVVDPAGGRIEDLVRLAQPLIGMPITYDQQELTARQLRISFQGTMRVAKDEFRGLFQTLLFTSGFGFVERGTEGHPILELVSLNGPRRSEVAAGARLVRPEELEGYANRVGEQIQTILELEHLTASSAANRIRPFFAAQATQSSQLLNAPLGEDGGSLLLQGFAPQVYQAAQLLRAADQAAGRLREQAIVVRLEHRDPDLVAAVLNAMDQVRGPVQHAGPTQKPLRAVPDTTTRSLVLTGTQAQLQRAKDVISRLDVPVERR